MNPFAAAAGAYLAGAGLVLSAIDLRWRRLPDVIVLPSYLVLAGLLVGASAWAGDWWPLQRGLLTGLVTAGGYWLVQRLSPQGLGLGDVKLAGLLALGLGYLGVGPAVVGAVAAFALGGIAGLVPLALAPSGQRGRVTLAFGPWMCAGALVGALYGGPVWAAYAGAIGL